MRSIVSIPPPSRSITLSPSRSLHPTILLSAYIHICLYLLDPPLTRPSFYNVLYSSSISFYHSFSISLPPSHYILLSAYIHLCLYPFDPPHSRPSFYMHSIPPVSRSITLSPSHSLHPTIILSAYIHLCLYPFDPPHSRPSFYMHSIPSVSRSITLSPSHSLHPTIILSA